MDNTHCETDDNDNSGDHAECDHAGGEKPYTFDELDQIRREPAHGVPFTR